MYWFCLLQKIIEETRELLESLDGVTTVHSRFYNLSSSYQHIVKNHAEYYKDALRFLGCTKIEDIARECVIIYSFASNLSCVFFFFFVLFCFFQLVKKKKPH